MKVHTTSDEKMSEGRKGSKVKSWVNPLWKPAKSGSEELVDKQSKTAMSSSPLSPAPLIDSCSQGKSCLFKHTVSPNLPRYLVRINDYLINTLLLNYHLTKSSSINARRNFQTTVKKNECSPPSFPTFSFPTSLFHPCPQINTFWDLFFCIYTLMSSIPF